MFEEYKSSYNSATLGLLSLKVLSRSTLMELSVQSGANLGGAVTLETFDAKWK